MSTPTSAAVQPTEARKILEAPGPVTAEKLRAAELFLTLNKMEPTWPLWKVAEVTMAAIAVGTPIPFAHVAGVAFAVVYAAAMIRHSAGASKAVVEHDPDWASTLTGDAAVNPATALRIAGIGSALVLVGAAIGVTFIHGTAYRVIAGMFAAFILRAAYRRVRAHRLAVTTMADAEGTSLHRQHTAEHALRVAAGTVLHTPDA